MLQNPNVFNIEAESTIEYTNKLVEHKEQNRFLSYLSIQFEGFHFY